MLTQEKLKERSKSIGSSEAAAVLGLSRWDTPLSVWARKTGTLIDEPKDSLPIEVGNELEDLVCKLFMKRTGLITRKVKETLVHPKYDFITANIDRRIQGTDDILEAKTASGWKAKEWAGEDVPKEYIIQVMHQLGVTGKKSAWVAVLIGGNQDFIWKNLPRDEDLIKKIIDTEVHFWREYVEKNVMPMAVASDSEVLNSLFPVADEGTTVELTDEANKLIESRNALIQDMKFCELQADQAENALKQMLGTAAAGVTDRYKLYWRNIVKPAHQVKESRYRQFRISKLDTKEK